MKRLLPIICLPVVFAACSNPDSDGRSAAKEYYACESNANQSLESAYADLINRFDSYNFTTRAEVREKLAVIETASSEECARCLTRAESHYERLRGKYAGDYKRYAGFETAFQAQLEAYSATSNDRNISALLSRIDDKRLSIIPPRPDERKIREDLAGRTIIEPTRKKYRDKFEVRTTDNVQGIAISETRETDGELFYAVKADLKGEVNRYSAELNITYDLGRHDDWTIQHIESRHLDIIPTGKYDNCVTARLVESGWGGINTISFTNNCDIPLLVEGIVFYNKEWRPFSALIDATDSRTAHSGFSDIKDFRIQRVERP